MTFLKGILLIAILVSFYREDYKAAKYGKSYIWGWLLHILAILAWTAFAVMV